MKLNNMRLEQLSSQMLDDEIRRVIAVLASIKSPGMYHVTLERFDHLYATRLLRREVARLECAIEEAEADNDGADTYDMHIKLEELERELVYHSNQYTPPDPDDLIPF